MFASVLPISNLKGILPKQYQQNEIYQVCFSKCLHIPMFLLPRDTLWSLLWPIVKLRGRFLLEGVQVCYLDWKTKEGTMKKTMVTFFWCHFCLHTSFQNSYISAERVIDILGNAETCPASWNRKKNRKIQFQQLNKSPMLWWSTAWKTKIFFFFSPGFL